MDPPHFVVFPPHFDVFCGGNIIFLGGPTTFRGHCVVETSIFFALDKGYSGVKTQEKFHKMCEIH